MENQQNRNYRQEDGAPQDYTQHPTGAHFTRNDIPGNVAHHFVTYPQRTSNLLNDLENDYPAGNTFVNELKVENSLDSDSVIGRENTFDDFNDTDPNRYNNNAGLGIPNSDNV